MAVHPVDPHSTSTDVDRVCVNCGKIVNPHRERLCDHCGLPFRTVSAEAPRIQEPGSDTRLLLKLVATLAFALPALGPLTSLPNDAGTLLGFSTVVLAGVAAVAFAWRWPLPGGILVALVGVAPFVVELFADVAGAPDPSSRYWLFWFFPGGLVGGTLFLVTAFWPAPMLREAGGRPEGAGRVSLAERVRREAIGLTVLLVVGFVFAAVLASYPDGVGSDQPVPAAILILGFPVLLLGAGALGYREDGVRGSFVAGLVAAAVSMFGIGVALEFAGQTSFRVGEGEWAGEAWLAVGLAILGGGFFGLFGGGITAMIGRRFDHS